MNIIEHVVHMLQTLFRKQRRNLITYNIVGLSRMVNVSEDERAEMERQIDSFNNFAVEISQKYESLIAKYLYGDLTKAEAEKILSQYSLVDEGMKHIPGRIPIESVLSEKTKTIIHPIIDKLKQLMILGKANKIYHDDFLNLKKTLLELLFHKLSGVDDLPDIKFATTELTSIGMLPSDVTWKEISQYCPIGRWM